jgi:hypothetical protein
MQSACFMLYCDMWRVRLCHIFSTLSHKRYIFGKKLLNIKLCFDFLYNFVWDISHSEKNLARCSHKCTHVFMWSARYFCQSLMKNEFSRQIFEKYWNIKFHENPSSESRLVPCGRTDMTKLIVAFRNFANAPKNSSSVRLIGIGWKCAKR